MSGVLHVLVVATVFWVAYRRDRGVFTLGTLFAARWGVLIAAYAVAPIPYRDIDIATWVALYSSLALTLSGYWAGTRRSHIGVSPGGEEKAPSPRSGVQVSGVTGRYLWGWVAGLSVVGFAALGYYIVAIGSNFSLDALVFDREALRISIREEGALPGFHYFYILELLPALCIYTRRVASKSLGRWEHLALKVVPALAFIGLFAKTGRSNIGKAVMLAFFVWLVARYGFPKWRGVLRALAPVVLIMAMVMLGLGLARGKSFDQPPMNDVVQDPGTVGVPLLLLHRYAAPVPTLDGLLNDESISPTWGALTLRPIAQVAGAVYPDYRAPSHIGEFYDTPYTFNVATQLDVMYKDFGWPGMLIGSTLFGFGIGRVEAWRQEGRGSHTGRFIWALVAMFVWAAPAAAAFIKMNYMVQIVLVCIIGYGMAKRERLGHQSRVGLGEG